MGRLLAGIAHSIISPPAGVDLTGYAGRPGPNTGVHDNLYAKVLILSDGMSRAAVISLDLLGLDAAQVASVRQAIERETGIPGRNVLVAASHTHSGPATQKLRACGKPNAAYVNELLERIAVTAIDAAGRLSPVEAGFAVGRAGIGINRRYRAPSGEVTIGENASGVTDPEVGVLSFRRADGRHLALVFNHACHAVVMSNDNLLVSADWPGAAAQAIQQRLGSQAMFLQGCCGNINPRERSSFEVVERLGNEVAQSVLTALRGITYRADAELSVVGRVLELPLQPPPGREELQRIRNENAEALKELDRSTSPGKVDIAQAYCDWAQTLLAGNPEGKASIPFEVQVIRLGDCSIVALPGEVFVEYGLQIKALKPRIMVAAYANGNIGYVPTRAAFDEGGYEVDFAYKLYMEQMITGEAEQLILSAAADLLGQ